MHKENFVVSKEEAISIHYCLSFVCERVLRDAHSSSEVGHSDEFARYNERAAELNAIIRKLDEVLNSFPG
jgi:hypothetical protein